MAVTLTTYAPYTLTNNATSPLATKITFLGGTVGVFIHSVTDGTRVSNTGTDGVDIGANYMLVTETLAPFYLPLPSAQYGNPPVVYFAHDDSSGVTHLLPVFGERP